MKQGKINPEKIKKILKAQYMKRFFSQHLDKIFPEVEKIKSLKIETIKKFRKKDYFSYVVRYQLKGNLVSGESCEKAFYGSADNLKNSRQRRFLILKNLEKQGFTSGSWLTSYPLAYFPQFNLLLTKSLPGKTLSFYLMKNKKDLQKIFSELARFLAELHKIKIKHLKEFSLLREKYNFFDYTIRATAREYPERLQQIMKLASHIFLFEQKFYNKKYFTFIHGDLHPSNITVDSRGNIGILDFSRSAFFDPAMDVGGFIGQFQFGWFDYNLTNALSEKEKKELARVFLKKYLSETKYTSNFRERIKLQETKVIIQIVVHIINWIGFNKDNKKTIDFLIKQADKRLKEI